MSSNKFYVDTSGYAPVIIQGWPLAEKLTRGHGYPKGFPTLQQARDYVRDSTGHTNPKVVRPSPHGPAQQSSRVPAQPSPHAPVQPSPHGLVQPAGTIRVDNDSGTLTKRVTPAEAAALAELGLWP